MKNILELTVYYKDGCKAQTGFVCESLYNAGFAGKNQQQVRDHIRELADLGVPAPSTTPTLFPLPSYLLTTADAIQVQCGNTSGEVEYVLLRQDGRMYVGIASDHSDRDLENYSVAKAKQVCPNVMAADVWLYDEVQSHWNDLQLRCWSTRDGVERLYQEDTLAALLAPDAWFPVWEQLGLASENFAFLSGTISTLDGLHSADAYRIELYDPVLDRRIGCGYRVDVLKPGIE